jgi:adenosylcobinamide-GDP ribazoletransferase
MRPLLIALQFLTRLPVQLSSAPTPVELGRSLLWYPVIGLLIGALLCALNRGLAGIGPLLGAGLLLAVWVSLTGALHIDGLGDSADAWIGGRGDRERMLAIMKDPHAGPGAIAVIGIILLLKFSALATLTAGHGLELLLPPYLARSAIPALLASTPYVRPGGIGSAHAEQLPRGRAMVVVTIALALAVVSFGATGAIAVLVAAAVFMVFRAALMRSLGGTTGDTAGALIELIETAVLIAIAARPPD